MIPSVIPKTIETMKYAMVRLVFDRKHVATKNKTGLVQLEVTYNRKRKWFSTGIKVYADQWDERYKVVNSPHTFEYNDTLDAQLKQVQDFIKDGIQRNVPFSFDELTSFMKRTSANNTSLTFIEFIAERLLDRGDIRESTKRVHRTLLAALEEFKYIEHFSDITTANIARFDDWLHGKDYLQTTIYGYHKRLKAYINEAIRFDYLTANPYSKLKIERGKSKGIKYLTMDELKRIESCTIIDKAVERVRDLFVFQSYTGLSYGDLAKFDFSKTERQGNCYVIRDTRQKTDEEYFVVILDKAMQVLKKYDYKLPVISNAKYNQYLKVVASYASIDKPVSTHWARHTYAVMALSLGVRMEHISKMLGHSSTRITESTYAKVLAVDIQKDFELLQEKLKK